MSSSLFTHFPSATYGISYESDRHYNLFTPTNSTDAVATQDWVYNFLTQCWTNWPLTATAGIVSLTPDNHLYLCYSNGQVVRERKDWTVFDFADFEFPVTVVSSSGLTVTLTSTTNISVGDTLYQQDSLGSFIGQSIITNVVNPTTIDVTDNISWIAGAATVYQPISVGAVYNPIGGNFAWVKHFQDFQAFFRDATFTNLQFGFSSDFDLSTENTTITAILGKGFGTVPFGEEPFGGVATIPQVARTLVPRNMARCHWLTPSITHAEALSNYALTGINFFYVYVSSRSK